MKIRELPPIADLDQDRIGQIQVIEIGLPGWIQCVFRSFVW